MEQVTENTKTQAKTRRTIIKIIKIKQEQDSANESSEETLTEDKNTNQLSDLTCDMCGKSFFRADYVDEHKARQHSKEKPLKCSICPKSFVTRGDLRQHVKSHTKEKAYKCELCDKSYARASLRNYHMRKHTGERPYKCKLCCQAFARPFILRQHTLRIHGGEDVSKEVCEYCGKEFLGGEGGLRDLVNHLGTHTRPFACPENACGLTFSVKTSLKDHQAECHGTEEVFNCEAPDCLKKFKSKRLMKQHVSTVHKDLLYDCPFPKCSLSFKRKSALNRHLRTSKSHVKLKQNK